MNTYAVELKNPYEAALELAFDEFNKAYTDIKEDATPLRLAGSPSESNPQLRMYTAPQPSQTPQTPPIPLIKQRFASQTSSPDESLLVRLWSERDDVNTLRSFPETSSMTWYDEDYDHGRNMNQMCYCMEALKKTSKKFNNCMCCCKDDSQKDTSFYECDAGDQCEYYQISTKFYLVCSQCFNTKSDGLENKENQCNKDVFRLKKVKATINILNNEIEIYKDIEDRSQYMVFIRYIMHTMWIKKLNDSNMEKEFNMFYENHLNLIGKVIDLKELELNDGVIPNSAKTIDDIRLNKLCLEWQCLLHETEEKEAEFEDVCSGDLKQCSVRKRVKFIMNLYKKYFLCKYVYTYDEKNENDIFMK